MSQQYQKMKKKQYEQGFQDGKQQATKEILVLIEELKIRIENTSARDWYGSSRGILRSRVLFELEELKQQLKKLGEGK